MRRRDLAVAVAAALAAGCATPISQAPGLPGELIRSDDGTISGVWRDRRGLTLTINLTIGTFAVQRDCMISGGTLRPESRDTYRIGRFETGFADSRCGPWRSGPAIAPFDSNEVTLVREGVRLLATGGGQSLTLDRLRP